MKKINKYSLQIIKIQEELGISAKIMSSAMNIPLSTFNKKRSVKAIYYAFNEQDLINLKDFLKKYVNNL